MAAAALEQSILESKDKDTLLEMAKALGVKASARLKKGEIIDKILDTTGSGTPAVATASPTSSTPSPSIPTAGDPAGNGAGSPTRSWEPVASPDVIMRFAKRVPCPKEPCRGPAIRTVTSIP